jgi:DNA-binding MarR family transcriptional regulator
MGWSRVGVEPEDVVRLRTALGRISRQVERQVSGGVLTRTQVSVLSVVARCGPLGVSDLAEREGVNPTMLSRVIGKLAAAGLLRRASDPTDRRAVLVAVTAKGTRLDARLREERTALFAQMLTALPDEMAVRLLGALPALESLAELLVPLRGSAPAARG